MKKKLIALLLCVILVFGLAACGKDKSEEGSDKETTPAESRDTDTTEAPGTTDTPETTEAVDPDPDGPTNGTWFHYSYGLNDEGYMEGIRALDYVDLSNLEELLVFEKADIEPDEETIQSEVDSFLGLFKEATTDRVIEDGDEVNIDYIGRIDGVAFDGGSTEGNGTTVTIGVTSYIDDFLEQLIGHKPGETFDVEVTFPDPYPNNPDLANKDAVFEVTVNYVNIAPELTDELVEEHHDDVVGYFQDEDIRTADDLRQFFYDWYWDYNLQSAVENAFREKVEVSEVPEKVVDITKSMQKIMFYSYYGMTLEDMISAYGYSEEELMSNLNVETTARVELVYQAIAEQQDIHVTEADFKEATGQEDNASFIETYGKGYIAQYVMKSRVAEYIKEIAVVNESEAAGAEDEETAGAEEEESAEAEDEEAAGTEDEEGAETEDEEAAGADN